MTPETKRGDPIPPIWKLAGPLFFLAASGFLAAILVVGWGPTILRRVSQEGLRPNLGVAGALFLFFGAVAVSAFVALLPWVLITIGPRRTVIGRIDDVRIVRTELSDGDAVEYFVRYTYGAPTAGGTTLFRVEEEVTESVAKGVTGRLPGHS